MWIRQPSAPGQPATILLDTEGLFDVKNPDADYDARMMTVTMLLSSSMIFNCVSKLDAETLRSLAFVTRLSKLIKMSDIESPEVAGFFFGNDISTFEL